MSSKYNDVDSCLQKIGFNKEYYRYYLYILRNKGVLVSDLQKIKNKKNLQDALNWLEANGFIFLTLTDEFINSITPIEPQIAFSAFFSRFLWNFIPEIDSMEDLDLNTRNQILEFKKCCNQLIKQTKPYKIEQNLLAIPNGDKLSNILSSSILEAKNIIKGVTVQNWTPNISLVWESIKEQIKHGVKYYRIADIRTLISFGFKINKRDIFKIGVNLRIVDINKLDEKYFIMDDDKLLVFEPDCSIDSFKLRGSLINNKAIVMRYINKFDSLWRIGTDSHLVLDFLEKHRVYMESVIRNEYSKDKNIKNLYLGIYDWGIFFKREYIKCSDREYDSYVRTLLEDKFIVKIYSGILEYSPLGYIPNIEEDILHWLNEVNIL